MPGRKLSREWTPEEVASETRDSDESLPEARTTHRRRLFSDRTKGGAEDQAGDEDYDVEEEYQLPGRPPLPDPPRRPDSAEGA
jgi:hypothetical protein